MLTNYERVFAAITELVKHVNNLHEENRITFIKVHKTADLMRVRRFSLRTGTEFVIELKDAGSYEVLANVVFYNDDTQASTLKSFIDIGYNGSWIAVTKLTSTEFSIHSAELNHIHMSIPPTHEEIFNKNIMSNIQISDDILIAAASLDIPELGCHCMVDVT